MNDVYARIREHRLEGLICRWQAELERARGGAVVAGADDAVHLDSETPQRLDMYNADETGADHGGPDLVKRPQSPSRYQFR